MSAFLTSLDVRYLDGKDWVLLAPLVVVAKDRLIRVPSGFVTDFASVPRIPLAFMLFGNIGHRAATVHDYLYQTGAVPREDADEALKALLVEETRVIKAPDRDWKQKVSDWISESLGTLRANLMYAGVRVGGASHYQGQ